MGYIEESLIRGEHIGYRAKLHKIIFFFPTLVFLSGLYAGKSHLAGFLLILGATSLIVAMIRYVTTEFGVTNRRVILKTGFIRRDVIEIAYPKIQGVVVHQSILGRILDYGTITVSGTGGLRNTFNLIANPLEFRARVYLQLRNRRGARG